MRLYKQDDLTVGARPVSYTLRSDRRTDRNPGSEFFADGTPIFCGISLALAIVALWAAASGHVDVSALML